MDANTHAFKAETRQLLDIVIHSLYSNKEIFLRELISNASDALDRLRFEALTTSDLCDSGEILEIRLEVDPAARTLSISDNGIGMSRDEVVENLGTIAKSGTRDVLRRLEASGQTGESLAQLIGQFGVGFYSAFMVADKVTVVTRRAGEQKATRWESTGGESFEVGEDHRFFRGTTVTLHLKPVDADDGVEDYTDVAMLERIVKRHSDFIPYPIRARRPRVDAAGRKEPGALEEVTLNSMRPVWTRPDSEVKEEEYTELYHHISHDWGEPLDRISLRAEGRVEYQALLFIPAKAPFDLFFREQRVGLQLYVRRVLILDRCEALLPGWLRFLRGVVDASDLELNVSRELLQHDRRILQMRRWLTRKVLDHLHETKRKDEAKYQRFWAEFGRVLKEGVASDGESRDRLVPLLLFPSSRDGGALTDLAGYVSRMKEGQGEIYYLAGDNRGVIESSPHLEAFTEQGYEVLYLLDPVDELMVPSLGEFEGKRLRSAAEGVVELGSEEERKTAREELERKSGEYRDLLASLEGRLEAWVRQVRLSTRLKASPARLVTEEGEMSPHLERLLRHTDAGLELPARKRVLELNPAHEVVTKLQARYAEDRRDPRLDDYAYLLLGYALLAEGSELPDPARFNRLLVDLMSRGL
ncbi:MAG TPA: molecular chaperone HtpG [Thermoanaerobaculia bacterium]|nr:molecular chaperone HtpG [Thermoanaerobaculia bacterium]